MDERRRRLLALGRDLFTATATTSCRCRRSEREAGISEALLYHPFPSKQALAPPASRTSPTG